MSKAALREKQKLYDEWKSKRDAQEISVESFAKPRNVIQPTVNKTGDPEIERQREENRRKFPEFAAFFDEVKRHFPGAYVTSITLKEAPSPTSHVSDVLDAQDDQQ